MIVQLPCGNFFDLRSFSCTSIRQESGHTILAFHLASSGYAPTVKCQNIEEAQRIARDVIDYMQAAEIVDSYPTSDEAECSEMAALRIVIERSSLTGLQVSVSTVPDAHDIFDRAERENAARLKKMAADDRRNKALAHHRPVGVPPEAGSSSFINDDNSKAWPFPPKEP